jgi:hypothetical protein
MPAAVLQRQLAHRDTPYTYPAISLSFTIAVLTTALHGVQWASKK